MSFFIIVIVNNPKDVSFKTPIITLLLFFDLCYLNSINFYCNKVIILSYLLVSFSLVSFFFLFFSGFFLDLFSLSALFNLIDFILDLQGFIVILIIFENKIHLQILFFFGILLIEVGIPLNLGFSLSLISYTN